MAGTLQFLQAFINAFNQGKPYESDVIAGVNNVGMVSCIGTTTSIQRLAASVGSIADWPAISGLTG